MRKTRIFAGVLAVVLLLSACAAPEDSTVHGTDSPIQKADLEAGYDENSVVNITCGGTEIFVDGAGAQWEKGVLTISGKGDYLLTGNLSGQILVKADGEAVHLILRDLTVTSPDGPALHTRKTEKLIITLEGQNTLSDSVAYTLEEGEDEPNACVFAKCDLTINGSGSLRVNGNYSHGIRSKDNLVLTGGTYTVNAVDSAVKGKDSISLWNVDMTLTSQGDGIHSDGTLQILGGSFTVSAGDDGIHAETELLIADGSIDIPRSYEGIEGQNVTISGGTIRLVSSDDGINAAVGENGGRDCSILISGGAVTVDASGDGVDSNGTLRIEGGTLYVNGPTSNGNGALDYDFSGTITGGTVFAVGAGGMAVGFGQESTQYSFMVNLNGAPGEKLVVSDGTGEEIASFYPTKTYQNVVFSSPDLKEGQLYTVSCGTQSVSVTLTSISTGFSGMSGFGGHRGPGPGNEGGFGGPGRP